MRYSKMLEESAFHGRRADYVWLLIVSCTILLVSRDELIFVRASSIPG